MLIVFLTRALTGALKRELNTFFKVLSGSLIAVNVVTKGAFTKARKKFSYTAFIELNELSIEKTTLNSPLRKWKGFFLVAVDGSSVKVPNTEEIVKHFGVQKSGANKDCPMARVSQSFDVLNMISLDLIISPIARTDEISLAERHISKARRDDLFLFDRGYPAFWLFWLIQNIGANFLARVKTSWSNQVKEFYESGAVDRIIILSPTSKSARVLREMGHMDIGALKVRLVRVELETGESEILITTLLDREAFPVTIFKELYFYRWPVEEDYKTMKHRVELENFSGKTVESVYQDFHAKALMKNLTAMIAIPVAKVVENETSARKPCYKINFTEALSNMRDAVILFFNSDIILPLARQFQKLISEITEPI